MGKVIAFTNLTLDGVFQSPSRPDEDRREGFAHGGWAARFGAMQEAGEAMGNCGALLFGRWTWEAFAGHFPKHPENPFSGFLGMIPKYVASRTLKAPLGWSNSTLLTGDAVPAVAELKQSMEKDLVIFGSGGLIQSLVAGRGVDQFTLLIHPVVLGTGRRLFTEPGAMAEFTLRDAVTTSKGVVVATYFPASR